METLQPVNDDGNSLKTSTTTSESKDKIEPEITSEPQNITKPEFIPREIEFLNWHRGKLRLCDPKGVYKFRHIKPTLFQSFLQLITMLISSASLFYCYYLTYTEPKFLIAGVGEVSSLTWVDVLAFIAIAVIIVTALKNLGIQLKQHYLKSYLLAMFSNSLNRVILNNVRIFILIGVGIVVGIQDPTYETIDLEFLNEGVIADIFSALYSLLTVIITFRAFRFCRKELAE
ncbi:membrane protein [Moritella viscosa]|nr:hypothetical protein [Moritella viscosa]CED59511.1 membrane protein [Moritella viscosa]SHO01958.1 Putative uncharacterized protein [Moritella viscosa]